MAEKAFISAVTRELGSFRLAVRDELFTKGVLPVLQDHFPPDYRDLRRVLADQIEDCDAVICLVGFVYGAEPRNRPEGASRRSYTQLEFDIAVEMGKPVYVFLSDDEARPADPCPEEEPEERQLQLAHRAALRARVEKWETFDSVEDLRRQIAELPPVKRAGVQVAAGHLRHGAEHLFGRESELGRLDAAWEDPKTHVLSIVAWGGVGKTSLVGKWMARLAAEGWRGAVSAGRGRWGS